MLVQDVSEGVLDLLAVRVEVEHVAHHVPQPVIGEFLAVKTRNSIDQ